MLRAQIALARPGAELDKYLRLLRQHHKEVGEDRDELARIARLCKIDPRHVGFMLDALDKQKMGLPTTECQAKCLSKLPRIVQKLTGL